MERSSSGVAWLMRSSDMDVDVEATLMPSRRASTVRGGDDGREAGGGVGVTLRPGTVLRCDEGGGVIDECDAPLTCSAWLEVSGAGRAACFGVGVAGNDVSVDATMSRSTESCELMMTCGLSESRGVRKRYFG